MAVKELAKRAADLAAKYGPSVVARADQALGLATGGKPVTVANLAEYVKTPQQLSIATQALASAGVNVAEAMPDDLVGNDRVLAQIRASAARVIAGAQARYAAGSDQSLAQGPDGIAADYLRRQRVEAVLNTYGSQKNYFLCHPNGAVPAEDFVWHKTVILGQRF